MNLRVLSALTTMALAGASAFAALVPITPGGTVSAFTPTTAAFTGTFVNTYTANFNNAFENGTVVESVYQNPDGTLNFYYKLTNSGTSADYLTRLTVGDFAGFTTSVDYLTNGGAIPTSATLQNAGDSVGFYIKTTPGSSTNWLEVSTNAKTLNSNGTISLIDSLSTNFTGTLGPATPEPLTICLLGCGLFALGLARTKLTIQSAGARPCRREG